MARKEILDKIDKMETIEYSYVDYNGKGLFNQPFVNKKELKQSLDAQSQDGSIRKDELGYFSLPNSTPDTQTPSGNSEKKSTFTTRETSHKLEDRKA